MKQYLSTVQAAKIMGISREAVLKQIKTGKLPAVRIGRNYAIDRNDLGGIYRTITPKDKQSISRAVGKVVKDYSSALKRLGKE